jgi:electron transfer flavoprotein beta subunit
VKGVPDFREGKVQFKEDNTLNRGATPTVLNPNDHLALEAALEARVKHGGKVRLMTMGPPNYNSIIGEAMQWCGEEGYLLSDRKMGGADTWATAWTLSTAIRKLPEFPDVIFAGFKSADGETGQTGPQTAWFLGIPIITHCTKLEVFPSERKVVAERVVYDEVEEVEAPLPVMIVTDPGFTVSYTKATHRLKLLKEKEEAAKRAPSFASLVTTWDAAALGLPDEMVGLKGSPTIVRMVEPIPVAPKERTARILDGNQEEDLHELARIIRAKIKGVA